MHRTAELRRKPDANVVIDATTTDDEEDMRASVREMAAKFEQLMKQQLLQLPKAVELRKSRLAKRQSSRPAPPEKDTAPQSRPASVTLRSSHRSSSASSAASPRSSNSVFYAPTPEVPNRRSRRSSQNRPSRGSAGSGTRTPATEHDDDLLFDNLITDITEFIQRESMALAATSDDTIDGDDDDDDGDGNDGDNDNNSTKRDGAGDAGADSIYQNIAAALADKQRVENSASLRNGQRVMQEMLDNERAYIAALTTGIDQYIMAPEADDRPEQAVQEQIFGNIIVIRNFHENTFLPALANSGTDVERLCACFKRYIEDGYFYSYIEYAINRQRADHLVEQHNAYFRRRQAEVLDALGLENFLIQPIQRLPKYQLLLYQLIQHLGTRLSRDDDIDSEGTPNAESNHDVKMQIAACCRAEKHIQRLLDRLNASMTIADIVDFHTNLEFLLLNIGENGEFRLVQEFDIHDLEHKRRYRGKLFLFDKCVVFTETLDRNTLRFRGFYQQRHVGIAFAEGRNVFYLYHRRRGNQEIECGAETPETIHVWSEALGRMMLQSVGLVSWGTGGKKAGGTVASRNPKLSLG